MKKTIKYSSAILLASIFTLYSCNTAEIDNIEKKGPVQETISLTFRSSELVTKADYPAGDADGKYNENLIKTIDYFVYDVDPVTNKTATAILQGRFDFGKGFDASDEKARKANIEYIELKESSLMKRDEESGKITGSNPAYLYVLANMPSDYTPTETGYKYTDASGNTQIVTNTLANLEALEIVTKFNESIKDGKFVPQESFVMKGAVSDPISLDSKAPVDVTVDLTRIAAKITLDMNIIEITEEYFVTEGGSPDYQGTWVPNTEKIQAYLQFANNKGTIEGNYKGRVHNSTDYFMYNRHAFIAKTSENTGSFKEPKRYPNGVQIIDDDGKPVYVEYPAYAVTGTPFYSYPTTWETKDMTAPFIKIIIPWVKYYFNDQYRQLNEEGKEKLRTEVVNELKDFPAETKYGNRVTPENKIEEDGGEEFFYKINIPIRDGEPNALQANGWHKIDLNIAILGGSDDDIAVEIAGNYYVVDWSDPEEVLGGDLNSGRYIDVVSQKTNPVGNRRYYVFEGNAIEKIEIPVSSSHNLSVYYNTKDNTDPFNPTGTFNDYSNVDVSSGILKYSTESDEGVNFKITPNGRLSVTLSHQLISNLDDLRSKDVSPMTYRFRIQHSDNPSYYRDIEVIQYPQMYIISDQNSDGYTNWRTGTGQNHGYVWVNDNSSELWDWRDVRQDLYTSGEGSNYNANMYVISTSSLFGSSYTIGDPRGDTITEDSDHRWQEARSVENMSGKKRTLKKYNRAENSDRTITMIAPKIRVASSWGAAGQYGFENASRRCASYQEDGIPAGRWRLPTEAEVKFIVTLSSNKVIPVLFGALPASGEQSDTSTYWTANGSITVTYYRNGSSKVSTDPSTKGSNYIRCVYDEWYWGSTTNDDDVRSKYRDEFTWGDKIN